MAAVAAEAGVSLKTVYVVFETRAACCGQSGTACCAAMVTASRSVSSPGFRRVLDEPDPRTELKLNAQNSREVKQRAGQIMAVIQAAAPGDAEIGALWQRIQTSFTRISGRWS